MVVALCAGHCQAEPGGARRVDAIKEIDKSLLFRDRPTFAVEQMVAVEAAGDPLPLSCVRHEVAGELFDGELIKRHVGVEGSHHPIPPDPLPGVAVLLKAVGVGIAGGVEPGQHHPFAVVRARQQPVDELLVGGRIVVRHEGIDVGRCWRQAGEIEREATDQGGPVGFR